MVSERSASSAHSTPDAMVAPSIHGMAPRYDEGLADIGLQGSPGPEEARRMERDELIRNLFAWRRTAANLVAGLTQRERQVLDLVLAGHPSKLIAITLGIRQGTVENLRAAIMKKTGSKSHSALAQLANAAVWNDIPNISLLWNAP